MTELRLATLLNKDGLAWQNVDNVGEAELGEGDGFRGHEVVQSAFEGGRGARSKTERSDAILVSAVKVSCAASTKCNNAYLKPRMPKPVIMATQAKPPLHRA